MNRNYTFFDSGRHEYLQVSKTDLIELDVWYEMSPFSYEDEQQEFIYLEEDMDAGTFIAAAKEAGWQLSFDHTYVPNFPTLKKGLAPLSRLSNDPRCRECRANRERDCSCPRLICPFCGLEASLGEEISIEYFDCQHFLAGKDDSGSKRSAFDFDFDYGLKFDPNFSYPNDEIEEVFGELSPFYELFRRDNGAVRKMEFWELVSDIMSEIKVVNFYHQPPGAMIGWEATAYFAEKPNKLMKSIHKLIKELKKRFRLLTKSTPKINSSLLPD